MQRKKTPLLSRAPLVLHSICRRKSAHWPSVCRSPGPFLIVNSPSVLTLKSDLARALSFSYFFQPDRSLPLKSDLASSGRSFTLRRYSLASLRWGGLNVRSDDPYCFFSS